MQIAVFRDCLSIGCLDYYLSDSANLVCMYVSSDPISPNIVSMCPASKIHVPGNGMIAPSIIGCHCKHCVFLYALVCAMLGCCRVSTICLCGQPEEIISMTRHALSCSC